MPKPGANFVEMLFLASRIVHASQPPSVRGPGRCSHRSGIVQGGDTLSLHFVSPPAHLPSPWLQRLKPLADLDSPE